MKAVTNLKTHSNIVSLHHPTIICCILQ